VTLAASNYEMEILRLIGATTTMTALLAAGPWSADDVLITLRRNGLRATEGGAIIKGVDPGVLLDEALESPSPVVRRYAARAQALLTEISRLDAVEASGERAELLRRQQRNAVEQWIAFLRTAREDAQIELRRLQQLYGKRRHARNEAT
jgi:hypothetical protein